MHASPGGSVVDQSLLRQAADRGVTICFADLDGADGLWVPEERTVLVNRGLPEAKVAEVIEHELAHVMIDDQHADLDAGKEVVVGQPPGRRREAVALAAALGLVAVVGGVMYGIHTARGPTKLDRVAPNPNAGLTAGETANPRPTTTVIRTTLPDGRVIERTIVITATPPLPTGTGSPFMIPTGTATATKAPPRPTTPRTTPGGPAGGPTSPVPTQPPQTTDPPQTTPPAEPTTAAPTTPADETAGSVGDTGGVGDTDNGPVGTDPATAANASAVVPVDGTTGP